MVSRDQLLKYGALLLILVFVGETVFLGLSNFNSANPENAPTPTPLSFIGSAEVSGKVVQLGFGALAVCDSGTKLDEELKSSPGVRSALFASSEVLAVQFEQNASLDFAVSRVLEACGSILFRSAVIDLTPAQVVLNTSNGTQPVATRQLEAYFSNLGFPGFQAFISPSLKPGDALNVTVSVVVSDNQFESVTAQQPERDAEVVWTPSSAVTPSVNASAPLGNASSPDASVAVVNSSQ